MSTLDKYRRVIRTLCAQHKVKSLYAFGSVLTDQFNPDSDIDFVVDFQPLSLDQYADNYFSLKFALEDAFERSIDLLEEKGIKNPYFKRSIETTRQLIYGN